MLLKLYYYRYYQTWIQVLQVHLLQMFQVLQLTLSFNLWVERFKFTKFVCSGICSNRNYQTRYRNEKVLRLIKSLPSFFHHIFLLNWFWLFCLSSIGQRKQYKKIRNIYVIFIHITIMKDSALGASNSTVKLYLQNKLLSEYPYYCPMIHLKHSWFCLYRSTVVIGCSYCSIVWSIYCD